MLRAEAGLLVASERNIDALGVDFIHPYHARLQTIRDSNCCLRVATPHPTAQSKRAVVCTRDHIFHIVISDDWNNGTGNSISGRLLRSSEPRNVSARAMEPAARRV